MKIKLRSELLEAISELQRRYPNWRLGQLVANVAGWTDQDVWNVEDEQLLQAAQLHLQQPTDEAPALATDRRYPDSGR